MNRLKTTAEIVQPSEELQIMPTLPTPAAGLADAQAQLDAAERTAREAKARIAEIHAKRERLFFLNEEITKAEEGLSQARDIHAAHLESEARMPGEIATAMGRTDPTGGLTRNHYAMLSGVKTALADWPRIEAIYLDRVEKAQAAHAALLAEVEALISGTEKPAVRMPASQLKTEWRQIPGTLNTESLPLDPNR